MIKIEKPIDFTCIFRAAWKRKKLFLYGLPISFVSACLLILCVPRYYRCQVSLAPEVMSAGSSSSLSSLASSIGVNLSSKMGAMTDAFYPELYPDILNTTSFRLQLFNINVKTKDGKVNTDYYNYLLKHQKAAWWDILMAQVSLLFQSEDSKREANITKIDPFMLTRFQTGMLNVVGSNVNCSVDKRTDIITITVQDQDPLVCAMLADSVRCRLQDFITDYRTSKARADMEYLHKLYVQAKEKYEKARQRYASFSDANMDPVLTAVNSKRDDYENEMQLQYNNYSNFASQYQNAVARVQERTPAFTILQPASVPVKPAGPKRMIFVLVVVFLTFIGLTIYSVYKENKDANKRATDNSVTADEVEAAAPTTAQ